MGTETRYSGITDYHAKLYAYELFLTELKALRETHARYELERLMIRQRARQVLDELSLDEPVLGKVKRLVKKIVKLS